MWSRREDSSPSAGPRRRRSTWSSRRGPNLTGRSILPVESPLFEDWTNHLAPLYSSAHKGITMITRRTFSTSLAASAAVAATTTPFTAKSYAAIAGANERVNFAICGLNGRGGAHLSALASNKADAKVTHICDVDSNVLAKFAGNAQKELGYA